LISKLQIIWFHREEIILNLDSVNIVKSTPPKKPMDKILGNLNKYKILYILLFPGALSYLFFNYIPIYGILVAFKKYMLLKGIFASPWAPDHGFGYFIMLFKAEPFWRSVVNTIILSGGRIIFIFPIPIILAILLNELGQPLYKRAVQSVLYLPYFLSWVVIFGLVYSMFSVTAGFTGRLWGHAAPQIISNADVFRPLIFLTSIWKNSGYGTIIYLAAIAGIDPTYYESAYMDGANRFKQIIYVTLPLLRYAIVIMLILSLGSIMQSGFDQIFNFLDNSTLKVGEVIDTYIWRTGLQNGNYEIAAAAQLFQGIINMILLFSANKLAKVIGEEGIY
jgi:putative aldouronate transport system permease protein